MRRRRVRRRWKPERREPARGSAPQVARSSRPTRALACGAARQAGLAGFRRGERREGPRRAPRGTLAVRPALRRAVHRHPPRAGLRALAHPRRVEAAGGRGRDLFRLYRRAGLRLAGGGPPRARAAISGGRGCGSGGAGEAGAFPRPARLRRGSHPRGPRWRGVKQLGSGGSTRVKRSCCRYT